MEDIDPGFPSKIRPGHSVIVAGKNFGMGSSREQAPLVIKESGIVAVLARSFARIFYRNAFNIGLPLVEVDTRAIKDGDELDMDLDSGLLVNRTRTTRTQITPLPAFMQQLLREGGIVNYYKHHGKLPEVA
jgi:3-isopropylmalate/(R)-2-methylmalate dehydratase small subunit